MNKEFYDWFNEQSKHLSDTDKKLFMMWSSSTWNKQQETIDDQFEMLVNQAKTIKDYQERVDKLEKQLSCNHVFSGKSENQYCIKCGISW